MTKKPLLIVALLLVLFCSAGVAVLLAQDDRQTPTAATPAQGAAATLAADTSGAATLAAQPTPPPRVPDTFVPTGEGISYGISRTYGLLVSQDGGKSWTERNQGLPMRHVWPFKTDRVRFLTSLGVDPAHAPRLAVTTVDGILLSEDYGFTWQRIPIGKPMRETVYFTSIALSPFDGDTILAGTSFNGFFETRDRGATWCDPSLTAGFLNRGAGFYEEIAGITYHPADPGQILFALGFGKGCYRSSGDRRSWQRLPALGAGELVRALRFVPGSADATPAAQVLAGSAAAWTLEAQTRTGTWRLVEAEGRWLQEASRTAPAPQQARDVAPAGRRGAAGERTGIYISSFHATEGELDRYIAFLKQHRMNSLVVDFKEDLGMVTYDTRLELPRKMGAVSQRIRLEKLLEKAHANGIYIIGRVLVFKDRNLFNYDGFKHAAWDRVSNAPWRYITSVQNEETGETVSTQREYWVDPFSPFVWEYNVSIARELQDRGVDEIQFDYIRFPSDGPLSRIRYRFQQPGMDRIDALESFLTMARESVHVPISTDLYGFNTWHRMGNWIGQSIEVLSDYVDVICPMFYPSHFPRDFIRDKEYMERAFIIYQEGVSRAASIVEGRSLIRPYIQAFLIGDELRMGPAEYSRYLTRQLEGTLAAPSSGFTLWNASNRYYMVREPLQPFIRSTDAAAGPAGDR